jgi:hypothetical protein
VLSASSWRSGHQVQNRRSPVRRRYLVRCFVWFLGALIGVGSIVSSEQTGSGQVSVSAIRTEPMTHSVGMLRPHAPLRLKQITDGLAAMVDEEIKRGEGGDTDDDGEDGGTFWIMSASKQVKLVGAALIAGITDALRTAIAKKRRTDSALHSEGRAGARLANLGWASPSVHSSLSIRQRQPTAPALTGCADNRHGYASSSRSALASLRSGLSNPSVNHW